jgi:hypothetical protein
MRKLQRSRRHHGAVAAPQRSCSHGAGRVPVRGASQSWWRAPRQQSVWPPCWCGRTPHRRCRGNALLRVSDWGKISTLAAFPSRPQRSTDAVPTAVAQGPDGAYYVGELMGVRSP